MNEVVNKLLLVIYAWDGFKINWFTCSTCGPFPRNRESFQKFMQTWDIGYIYQNYLDKACFQQYMGDVSYKDLVKRTKSDKVLRDETFKIASDSK